jgi:hypothetical protein
MWTALVTIAATGRLTRWVPSRSRVAPGAAALSACVTRPSTWPLLTLLASGLAPRSNPRPPLQQPVGSLTRVTPAERVARRRLAARRTAVGWPRSLRGATDTPARD